jgi:hypothetical protein
LAERLGLNLSEIPERLGISKAMLFAYRKGTSRITNKVWIKLGEAERKAGMGSLPVSYQSQSNGAAEAPVLMDEPAAMDPLLRIALALERIARAMESANVETNLPPKEMP